MRRLIIYSFSVFALAISSCSDSFLDTELLTKKTDVNFYQTPTDANQALTAVYAVLPLVPPSQNILLTSEIMSDDRFGGGGQNDHMGAVDQFKKTDDNQYKYAWSGYYQGVFRVNTLIKKLPQVTGWASTDDLNKVDGEAHFLRAYFYFDLMRMFGGAIDGKPMGVPLITDPSAPTAERATVDAVYAQIASDLKYAIEKFPSTAYSASAGASLGHANKWAAEALMARVFLFYTGYYSKEYGKTATTLPLVDGSSLSKSDVIAYLEDCITKSGYSLVSDFRNLWPYSNSYTAKDYGYAKNNNLSWVGEEGGNTESMFAIKFSNLADWSTNIYYSNQTDLYFGLRNQSLLPFGQGWGMGTVSTALWNAWPDNDIRKRGSIFNAASATELAAEGIKGGTYAWGGDKQMHETGLWQKKYIPINAYDATGALVNYSCILNATPVNFQLDNTQDIIPIRFADVLLMASELKEDATYLNQLRSKRGGLAPVSYSLKAIQDERRFELAFEGVRYFDELRWGTIDSDLDAINGQDFKNVNIAAKYVSPTVRRKATHGMLPIPLKEINLSSNVLVQNDGWTSSDANFTE